MKIKKYGYRVQKAQEQFNRFIVLRDSGKPCASCGRYLPLCCGHFRSVGAAPELRFNEDNAHGQCYEMQREQIGEFERVPTWTYRTYRTISLRNVRKLSLSAELDGV